MKLTQELPGVLSPRMAASKRAASLGGQASARRATVEQREERSRKGGSTTLSRYGHSFYRYMALTRWRKKARLT
jgi:hypothetical protein